MQQAQEDEAEEGRQINVTYDSIVSTDMPVAEFGFHDPLEEMGDQKTHLVMKTLSPDDEIDPYPDQEMMEWNQNVEHLERWTIFRMFPAFLKLNQQMKDFFDQAQKQELKSQKEVVLPSLYRYYNTLPQFARESPMVKNLVRAFEYTKHGMSIREKELSLNYICQFTLPMDECTNQIVLINYKFK